MTGTERPPEVLVVGAGPVGLTLALALSHQGVAVRIIDKGLASSGASKAVTIMPRSLELYRLLGVADKLVDAGVRSDAMHVHVGTHYVTTWRFDRLVSDYPFYLHLHQGHTEEVLTQALAERGVPVERGTSLVDFVQTDDAVTATLTTTGGHTEQLVTPFLAGCDGGHSRVRTITGTEFHEKKHVDNWIMTDVRIPNMPLDPDQRHGFLLDRYPFVVLPLGNDYYRLISARLPDSPLLGTDPSLDEFQAIIDGLELGTWEMVDPKWLTNYRPRQCLVERYRTGRVMLVGDAAHLNSPIAAQGLNTGALDAFNLAWKLQMTLQGQAKMSILNSYEEERKPAAKQMFAENDRLTRMVFGKSAMVRKLARGRLQLFRLPSANLKNVLQTSQIGLDYRNSPVVGPSGWLDAVRPGDRLPAAKLNCELTLHDTIRCDQHVLLLFNADGPIEALSPLADCANTSFSDILRVQWVMSPSSSSAGRAVHCVHDASGHAHQALGFTKPGAVVVRPDGYLGAVLKGRDVEGLRAYFAGLGH